jgi:hypothetical protein
MEAAARLTRSLETIPLLTRGATIPDEGSPHVSVCEKITGANAPFRSRLGNPVKKQSILRRRARKQAIEDIFSQADSLAS